MGADSKIEWCDHTFNPWVGCTKISPACDHCYAEGWAKMAGRPELWNGTRNRTSAQNWKNPEKWNKQAEAEGRRYRVFCASLADVFDNQAAASWRVDLWELIHRTPHLDWLLLTKRPQNIAKMLPADWHEGWPHVWLGTTVENREEMLRRGPLLRDIPARVHFWSVEPMLSDIGTVPDDILPEWVICGGESGPGARPMQPAWARIMRDQCAASGVPFFMKQMGGVRKPFAPIPADLMIRQFPA